LLFTPLRRPLAGLLLVAACAAAAQQRAPVTLSADRIGGRTDGITEAEGAVELEQGPLKLRADRLRYDPASDRVRATGNVRIDRLGDRYAGSELELGLAELDGYFLEPQFFFARAQAGGRAERIHFLDSRRSQLVNAIYTSCALDGSGAPAWLLAADDVKLDFDANEGRAQGAVLRFYGVPILAAPVLSFALTDERKSGWLPPSINLDNRTGLEVGVPYYWNIAPNRDATLTPIVTTRRGLAAEVEFRYLEPRHAGEVDLRWLPHDRVENRSRWGLHLRHTGELPRGARYAVDALRVSDDRYWKDFARAVPSITPRLLSQHLRAERPFGAWGFDALAYARLQHWQVLDDADPAAAIVGPYQRSPQLGLRASRLGAAGWTLAVETEFNRFSRPDGDAAIAPLTGERVHALAHLAWPWRTPGMWLVPSLTLNLASYHTDQPMADGRRSASRTIPTVALDGGLRFERETRFLGRALTQTLEPRVQFVHTPRRAQNTLPNFDSAGLDFNTVSVFSPNAFAGIDRVSDAHHITAGLTSRWLDAGTGAEAMRAGIVQRLLLRDQLLTPEGIADTQRVSDVLLFGGAAIARRWTLDAALQYSPNLDRTVRSVLTARYSPGPLRTVSASYRLVRSASEQLDVGWQWPVWQRAQASAGGCAGSLYSVGRLNYSLRDSRITDSLIGVEYDAGCWIGRVVAERLSTGRSEATTRLLFQLELVGLSRLGSNPLQVLKDNIPGYRLLREERDSTPPIPVYE
jgi:LPS-assembly protein